MTENACSNCGTLTANHVFNVPTCEACDTAHRVEAERVRLSNEASLTKSRSTGGRGAPTIKTR